MLTIRLQRTGKKNSPDFRIILAESTAAASKKFVEILGSYNPRTKNFVVKDTERLQYWIGQHVTMSPTVHNLFVSKSIISEPKVKAFTTPKKAEEKTEAPAAPATPAASTEAPAEEPTAEAAPEETPAA